MRPISMSPCPHSFPSHGHHCGSLFLNATHVCSHLHPGEFPNSMEAPEFGRDSSPMARRKSANIEDLPNTPALREGGADKPAGEMGPTCFDRLASGLGWNGLDAALCTSLDSRHEGGTLEGQVPAAYKLQLGCPQSYRTLPRGAATSASSSQIALMGDAMLDAVPDGNVEGTLERSGSNQREDGRGNVGESATALSSTRAKSLSRPQRQAASASRTLRPVVSLQSKGEEGPLSLAGDIVPAPVQEALLRTASRSPRSIMRTASTKTESDNMAHLPASLGSSPAASSEFGYLSSMMPPTFQPTTQVEAHQSMRDEATEPEQGSASSSGVLPPLNVSRSFNDWPARKPAGAAMLALLTHSRLASGQDTSGPHTLSTGSPSGGQKKRNRVPADNDEPEAPGIGFGNQVPDSSPGSLSRSFAVSVPTRNGQLMEVSKEHSSTAIEFSRLTASPLRKAVSGNLIPGSPEPSQSLGRTLSFKEGLAPLQLDVGMPPKISGSSFSSSGIGTASSRLGASSFSGSPLGKSGLSESSKSSKSVLSKASLPPLNVDLSLDSLKKSLDTDMSSPTSCNGDGISSTSRGGAVSPLCLSPLPPHSPASVESSPSPVLHRRLTGNRFTIMEDCWQAAPQRKYDEQCHGLRSVHEIEEIEGPDAFFKGFGEDAPAHPTSKKNRSSFS